MAMCFCFCVATFMFYVSYCCLFYAGPLDSRVADVLHFIMFFIKLKLKENLNNSRLKTIKFYCSKQHGHLAMEMFQIVHLYLCM